MELGIYLRNLESGGNGLQPDGSKINVHSCRTDAKSGKHCRQQFRKLDWLPVRHDLFLPAAGDRVGNHGKQICFVNASDQLETGLLM